MSLLEQKPWHSLNIEDVIKELKTDPEKGLTSAEAERRLSLFGPNELEEKKKSLLKMFLEQFANFLIITLLIAAFISFILERARPLEAIAIFVVVLIMAIAGFAQQYRAEKTLEKLKQLAPSYTTVIRDGNEQQILSRLIVPGDIIVLREGDKVPADARIIKSWEFDVDESALTGESAPVEKVADVVLPEDTPVSDRRNMVFMGTHVVRGKALAVVVATGMRTEVGKIAALVATAEEEKTPLERELDYFGKVAGMIILGISLVVLVLNYYIEKDLIEAILLAVALAVAAIPEGLPAIATIVLAIGARNMAARNALVKKLAAVEALGACDVIASDKTGTITKGEMTVKRVVMADAEFEVEGVGYVPRGEIRLVNGPPDAERMLGELLRLIAPHVAPDVKLVQEDGQWKLRGSPTEGSALVLSMKGLGKDGFEKVINELPVVRTIPFDRFRKRKTTIHRDGDGYIVVSSGAPEMLLEICDRVVTKDGQQPLTEDAKKLLLEKINKLASEGYRTYAFAFKRVNDEAVVSADEEAVESGLIFLAVLGIIDPPREGVKEAVEIAKKAGIKVIMVTGDHKLTAMAVAKMIGLDVSEDTVLEGRELDRMSDEEFEEIVDKITVYARVTPEHKARIVKALKKKGHTVAMTGDGVNDAPALKMADIGVAMGIRGTDVAKEAAQLILLDDNFVTIVEAVKEGRRIFENLKKPIDFLLSCNLGEIAAITGGELLGLPAVFKPIQLLWINVVTDSFPAIALGVEPPEPGLMERPPRSKHERFVTRRRLAYYTVIGLVIAAFTLLMFYEAYSSMLHLGEELAVRYARTVAFTTIVFAEIGMGLAWRSENIPLHKLKTNWNLLLALALSIALQLLILYFPIPAVQHIIWDSFGIVPIGLEWLAWMLLLSAVIFGIDYIRKLLGIKV